MAPQEKTNQGNKSSARARKLAKELEAHARKEAETFGQKVLKAASGLQPSPKQLSERQAKRTGKKQPTGALPTRFDQSSAERASAERRSSYLPVYLDLIFGNLCSLFFLSPPFDYGFYYQGRGGGDQPYIQIVPPGEIITYSYALPGSGQMAQSLMVRDRLAGGFGVSWPGWSAGQNYSSLYMNSARLIGAAPSFQRLTISADVQVRGVSQIMSNSGESPNGLAFTSLNLHLDAHTSAGGFRGLDFSVINRFEGIPHAFAPNGYNLDSQRINETVRLTATVSAEEAREFEELSIRAESFAGVTNGSNLTANLSLVQYDPIEAIHSAGLTVPFISLMFCP